ncbi:DUF5703 domain-containing protein [Pontiella agarivorans]|uniref:DUF5703 domain-containing protein n=1 Tax=Pontiella agarivorans TaxID=3038953 RepID=A0ABU5N0P8_9BACT|nr:DUF5703 domain-containing protein [Pontiella agarivorans]MDZ8120020.1 DUF5703 domain-containing protein [Pontiella agarivorans]
MAGRCAVWGWMICVCGAVFGSEYWTDRYDVEWKTPSRDVQGNMPVGAGDMACNVWVEEKTGDLMFYMQRSGSFSEIGEHIKLGRIRIALDPNPLKGCADFSQRLVLKDGYISIKATGKGRGDFETRIKLWVDQFTHSVNVTIDADQPVRWSAAYESWRTEDKSLTEPEDKIEKGHIGTSRFGSFAYVLAPFEVIKRKDEGFSFDQNSVLFYHRNPEETLSPNFGIQQQGLESYKDQLTNVIANRTMGGRLFAENAIPAGEGEGKYYKTDFKSLILESKTAAKKHHLFVATHIAQREDVKEWVAELNASCKDVLKTQGNFARNQAWWNQFWERSYIVVNPDHKDETSPVWQIGRNYNLMRYVLGGNAYGEFPSKFNGGNLTFDDRPGYDPDWRRWGGDFFTAQNQRLLYWPMLKSGDFDMMIPQFDLYMMALPGAMIRVRDAFGHGGAAFCENTDPSGINIPFCYGWTNAPGHWAERGEEIPFCDPRVRGRIGAAAPVEKGVMINPSLSYYHALQLEFSYMLLERYLYTGESFERYMPFIRESLKFYDEHYQIREKARSGRTLDENGKLVIYPSQACEAYKGVKNPVDAVSGLRACLETLLSIDVPYISQGDKEYYQDFLKRVPDFPFGELEGHRVMSAAEGAPPAESSESPQWYPLFPYNRFTLLDDEMETFHNTWKYDNSMRRTHIGWNQSGIFLARMGLTDEALEYHKLKLGDDTKRRFPIYWGPNYDGIPDLNQGGAGMIGLQEMLMQTFGDKILILPAWPKDVDVDFKLHAPKNTTVEVCFRNGRVEKLIVTPARRQSDVVNCWEK